MKFEYTGRHIEVTPALRTHIEEQFKKIGHLFGNKPVKTHFTIEVERGRHRSEATVNWRNDVLTATTIAPDMYQSISQTVGKIEKQALRLKNKVIDRSHKAVKVGRLKQADSDIAPEPNPPRIIRSRNYEVEPMTSEEAALQLSGEEDQFLVFRNADDERISVLFKRKDGNYGLIQP